jgi:hypothetical protein
MIAVVGEFGAWFDERTLSHHSIPFDGSDLSLRILYHPLPPLDRNSGIAVIADADEIHKTMRSIRRSLGVGLIDYLIDRYTQAGQFNEVRRFAHVR